MAGAIESVAHVVREPTEFVTLVETATGSPPEVSNGGMGGTPKSGGCVSA
jgi:hypothetical protein